MSVELPVLPTPASEATIIFSHFQRDKVPTIEKGVVNVTDTDLDFIALSKGIVTHNHNVMDGMAFQPSRRHVAKARIQLIALCFCMYLLGWNDGSIGPLLPRIQRVYHVSIL